MGSRLRQTSKIIGRVFQAVVFYFRGWTFRGQQTDILWYCADGDRSLDLGGRRFAHILDSYRLLLTPNDRSLTITWVGSKLVGDRAFGIVVAPPVLVTISYILAGIIDRVRGAEQSSRSVLARRYFCDVIKRSGTSKVIGVQPPDELVFACADTGIPIYDLQHGAIGARSPYYERLGRESDVLRFLVWDSQTRDALRENFAVADHRIKIMEHPWLKLHQNIPRSVKQHFDDLYSNAERSLEPRNQSSVILVTLQWGMNELYPADFKDPVVPVGICAAIRACPSVIFWFRPHPLFAGCGDEYGWNQIRRLLGDLPNVRHCDPSLIALPTALELADGHITWDSSVVIEAVSLGIPSLVLSTTNHAQRDRTGSVVPPEPDAPRVFASYASSGLVTWASASRAGRSEEIIAFVRERDEMSSAESY